MLKNFCLYREQGNYHHTIDSRHLIIFLTFERCETIPNLYFFPCHPNFSYCIFQFCYYVQSYTKILQTCQGIERASHIGCFFSKDKKGWIWTNNLPVVRDLCFVWFSISVWILNSATSRLSVYDKKEESCRYSKNQVRI